MSVVIVLVMKARTNAQREVVELSSTLPPLSERDVQDARKAYARIYVGRISAWCSCCGQDWDSDLWEKRRRLTDGCPHCGARGPVVYSPRKRINEEKFYVSFVRRCGEWQVIRTALCERRTERQSLLTEGENMWFMGEVFQLWIKPGTANVIIGRTTYGNCFYCDIWKWGSPWEIRNVSNRYTIEGEVCGKVEIAGVVRRNGMKAIRKDCSLSSQLWEMMHEPKAEILAKAKQWELFRYMCRGNKAKVEEWWDTIRIASRHGYIIKDASIWFDMLEALSNCGKDVRNPHYICPADLMQAHDEAVMRDNRRRDRMVADRATRERGAYVKKVLKNPKEQEKYQERVGKWLGVIIREKDIVIRPLQDIKAFYEEGQAMCHCVFTNGYYRNPNTLILSARLKGVRLETIEVNTKTWQIVQCRGRHNQNSKYHDRIVRLMNKNMNKLIQCV